MKSLLIERVSNGWIVRPYSSEVRDDRTQVYVFNTLPDLIGALPLLLTEPVAEGPPGIQLDIKPQWHATPAHLFNCPDCRACMSHSNANTWVCSRCGWEWIGSKISISQSTTGPEE